METIVRNKKSYLRIFEGVRLTDPQVRELIKIGPPKNQIRQRGVFNLYRDLLRAPFGGNSQTTLILCLPPVAGSLEA